MQYLRELPEISSLGVDGDSIELELEQEIEKLPELRGESVVLTARYAAQIVIVVGQLIEHENIEGGPEVFCRIKIKGSCVGFTK